MLKIYVRNSAGEEVVADLKKGCEFEIEMENPALTTERMPVPFSTEISFPATMKNKTLFEYLPAYYMEPQRKSVPARITMCELEIVSGTLKYAGMEDGYLKYSFSGTSIEDQWKRKIWDLSQEREDEIFEETGGMTGGGGIAAGTFGDYMAFPVIVNESATGKFYDAFTPDVTPAIKYRNYLDQGGAKSFFTPAIYVREILFPVIDGFKYASEVIDAILDELVILGIYFNDDIVAPNDDVYGTGRPAGEWFNMLPDLTIKELFLEVSKLFGCVVFRDGDGYRLYSYQDILNSTPQDISAKVSGQYSCEVESKKVYRLSYDNSELSVKTAQEMYDEGSIPVAGTERYSSLAQLLSVTRTYVESLAEFHNEIVSGLPDVYSIMNAPGGYIASDCVKQYLGSLPSSEDADEVFENKISLEVVRCTPEKVYHSANTGGIKKIIAPVVPATDPTLERGKKAYIGLIVGNQMCDKGIAVNQAGTADVNTHVSLSIDSLMRNYHQGFANWMARDRQIVSVDLDFNEADVANFQLWRRVFFAQRLWITKKLTVDLTAEGQMSVRGEFIEF